MEVLFSVQRWEGRKTMDDELLKKLPKVELHCHLDGSLSLEFLKERLQMDVSLSQVQAGWQCRNLGEYLEKFDLPLLALQDREGLKEAGYDLIRSVADENVRYIEVRFAPLLSVHESFGTEQVIESVLEGLEKGKKEFQVEYNVIVCAMRHHSLSDNLAMIRAARQFLGEGVCAADLAGNEAAYPMSDFLELFREVKKLDMPFTIHAGECGSARNIADAVEAGASRIGHGIAMKGDADVRRLCKEKGIGIEMCPISNLQTKAIGDIREYPMNLFLEEGLFVTVNTDNRTVSGTTITNELKFIQKNCGVDDTAVLDMMKNAVRVSFVDEDIKNQLFHLYEIY